MHDQRFLLLGKSCGLMEIGSRTDGIGHDWSDRDLALMNGPITAFKVWHTACGVVAYVIVSKNEFYYI